MDAPNRNLLWAKVFVDELARVGLKVVCIAPGSRSTPLAIAFAEQVGIRVYSHIDERSAAFFALGLALSEDRPVAVLCSSGTATANFYPAIIEAHYSNVPLLVLTADRPPELRHSGANQTIDQVKLYGDHVLWAVDVALPEAEPPPLAFRNVRTLAARALATANGLPKGVVHLNFPFRKPLEPIPVERDLHTIADVRPTSVPLTQLWRGTLTPDPTQITALADQMRAARRGVIVCGPRCPGGGFPSAVRRLAGVSGCLLIADPLSGVRYGSDAEGVLSGYDSYLAIAREAIGTPDLIVSFGRAVTSQALDDYLNAGDSAKRWLISADGVWADPNHRVDVAWWADPTIVCESVVDNLSTQPSIHLTPLLAANLTPQPPLRSNREGESEARDLAWRAWLMAAERTVRRIIAADEASYLDGLVLRDVIDGIPECANLFIANSLPVRNLDQFGLATPKGLNVFCNRGASGIDGTVSTALGVAAANPDNQMVLVTGDLAFYHDLNGLLAVKRCGVRAIIVVINNDGGGIFQRLPIAGFDPPFTELFATPHGLHFEPAARLYGLCYHSVMDSKGFRAAFAEALAGESATIIEVSTDRVHDLERRTELMAHIRSVLSTSSSL